MTMQKPVLGSVACLLLFGVAIAAAPVVAKPIASTNPANSATRNDPEDVDFHQRLIMQNVPALTRLEDVANVNDELFNTPVVDSWGYPAGHFRRVETKDPDYVVAVITLNFSRRTIAMLLDHVRYEPGKQLIIADLSQPEMARIPAEFFSEN